MIGEEGKSSVKGMVFAEIFKICDAIIKAGGKLLLCQKVVHPSVRKYLKTNVSAWFLITCGHAVGRSHNMGCPVLRIYPTDKSRVNKCSVEWTHVLYQVACGIFSTSHDLAVPQVCPWHLILHCLWHHFNFNLLLAWRRGSYCVFSCGQEKSSNVHWSKNTKN